MWCWKMPKRPKIQTEAPTLLGTEEAIAQILQQMTDINTISMFTDLEQQEINDIALSLIVSKYFKKKFNFTFMEDLVKEYLKLKVSLERKGRKEVVGMITLQNLFEARGGKSGKLSDLFAGLK